MYVYRYIEVKYTFKCVGYPNVDAFKGMLLNESTATKCVLLITLLISMTIRKQLAG